jgi:acetylglutamate kinase
VSAAHAGSAARRLAARPVVVKLGGRALEAAGDPRDLATALARLARPVVVVHGGGPEVTAWSRRIGLAERFHEGRRVTDAATLEVAAAVLAGLANKRLVAGLRAGGLDAIGLAALDGGLVECAPHAEAALLGAVGTVTRVSAAWLETLLAEGRVPVLASLGAHDGALLNLNADDLAGAVAAALSASALVLLSDAEALVLDGAKVQRLDVPGLAAARAHRDVKDGMAPKLAAAATALEGGVAKVAIGAWSGVDSFVQLLAGGHVSAGTLVERSQAGEISNV